MLTGIFAGITWALETVIIGIALGMTPMTASSDIIFLAPFIATFLHDAASSIFMLIYNIARGKIRELGRVFKNSNLKWLVMASVIGGPMGMTGYMMAVKYMGASVGAVASAVYPAIGTALACLFLKERVRWYQWIFLAVTLFGVYGLSYSPSIELENFWLGLLGALMCAFGWGIEAVILAKCLKDTSIKNEYALNIRQAVSALVYGIIILPVLGAWKTMGILVSQESVGKVFATIAFAAFFATVSYLLYYRTIGNLGAAKAMALNITYTAWAIVFTVIIIKDMSVLNPLTLLCAGVIVVCGILAATDLRSLFTRDTNKTVDASDQE